MRAFMRDEMTTVLCKVLDFYGLGVGLQVIQGFGPQV